ncbi:hypothetical protein BDN67DRAFT_992660 [Paxillus ammoniavirescens]|nr:hypothetical protein BDN67DRAFT_992660 [Paxillus ammoniavirescens]
MSDTEGVFHYELYRLLWNPVHKSRETAVYGELYTSKVFLEAHRQLQDQPPKSECDLPHHIVALMFWLDTTQLTSFGEAMLWSLYLYFGNDTKYERSQPSSNLCALMHTQGLPDSFKDFVLENVGDKVPGNPFFTHCHWELFHAQWHKLLDDEFVHAYKHGILLMSDYPEKVLIANIWNLGGCPCPHCLIPKDHDTVEQQKKIISARDLIYGQQYVVDTAQVEALLKAESLVPVQNAFSEKLSHMGFDFFVMLVVDLLHELELGVWKAILIHLLRMLNSLNGNVLSKLDYW